MSMLLRRYHETAETTEEQAEVEPAEVESEPLRAEAEESGQPAGNASKADWHAYALSVGIAEESLEDMTRDEIREAVTNVTAE